LSSKSVADRPAAPLFREPPAQPMNPTAMSSADARKNAGASKRLRQVAQVGGHDSALRSV
jgi:hypothetical protein